MGNTWNKDTAGPRHADGVSRRHAGRRVDHHQEDALRHILQASFLTAAGLAELDDAFNVFAMPFFFESDEEEMAVEKKLTPLLDQRLQAKGFHLLSWGTGGWIQVFSKKPLRSLADVKAAKLFTTKGADKWLQWYVANGFHPVALLPADIPTQLKVPDRPHRHGAKPAVSRAVAPDLPRREVHARPSHRAAHRGDDHFQHRMERHQRGGQTEGQPRRRRRSKSACAPKRRHRTPSRSSRWSLVGCR